MSDSAFKKVIDSIKKAIQDEPMTVSADLPEWPALSTGSVVLDKVIGIGGIPRGKVIEIFGDESAGKTTVAISLCVQAQKGAGQKETYPTTDEKGEKFCLVSAGSALYVDFEHAFHPGYARDLGLDLSRERFALYQPDYLEKGVAIINHFLKESEKLGHRIVDVIVIDSISAMIPKAEYEGNIEDSKRIGLQAAQLSQFLSQSTKKISKYGITLVAINQLKPAVVLDRYSGGLDTDSKRGYRTSGGRALKFYATVRIKLTAKQKEKALVRNPLTGKEDIVPISTTVKAETVKNKIWYPFRSGEFVIRFGEGIDNIRSVIDLAIANKVIAKSGSWFEYESPISKEHNFKLQGTEKLRAQVLASKGLIFEIQEQLISKSSSITKATEADISDAKIVVEEFDSDEYEEEE